MTRAIRLLVATVILMPSALSARDIANDPLPRPANPLSTPAGRFAHSIKIPNPVAADSGYRLGMTSQEYFEHLCRTESGEFVFKTVEKVAGLLMLRERPIPTDEMLMSRLALEDPYGLSYWEADQPAKIFVGSYGYGYLEIASRDNERTTYTRHSGFQSRWEGRKLVEKPMLSESSKVRRSRYAYTWRGVERFRARELGIAGGELIVLDLETLDVFAVKRGYVRSGDVKNTRTGIWWLTGQRCPQSPRQLFGAAEFVARVLRPSSTVESGERGRK